jgi:hypothetical protein
MSARSVQLSSYQWVKHKILSFFQPEIPILFVEKFLYNVVAGTPLSHVLAPLYGN